MLAAIDPEKLVTEIESYLRGTPLARSASAPKGQTILAVDYYKSRWTAQ